MSLQFRLDDGTPFEDPAERDRILRGIAHGNRSGAIRDIDGNKIGQYEFETTEAAEDAAPHAGRPSHESNRRRS